LDALDGLQRRGNELSIVADRHVASAFELKD
jgi:hypothetical protein